MVNANTKLQIKNNFIKILITLTFGMLLVSCGMPTTVITRGDATVVDKERIIMQGIALDTYYKRYEKLNNLTYPLLTKSTEFCGKRVTYDIGLKTISLNQIDKRFRKAAEEKLSITEKQKVLFTINNSPSDQAGIEPGDIIKWCASKLAYFKVPRYIEVRSDLPQTPSLRIRKDILRTEKTDLISDSFDREAAGINIR